MFRTRTRVLRNTGGQASPWAEQTQPKEHGAHEQTYITALISFRQFVSCSVLRRLPEAGGGYNSLLPECLGTGNYDSDSLRGRFHSQGCSDVLGLCKTGQRRGHILRRQASRLQQDGRKLSFLHWSLCAARALTWYPFRPSPFFCLQLRWMEEILHRLPTLIYNGQRSPPRTPFLTLSTGILQVVQDFCHWAKSAQPTFWNQC